MAGYATLQEAYNIDSFNRKTSKSEKSKNKPVQENFMNDYSTQDACYYNKEFGIDNTVCKSEIGKPDYGNFVASEKFTANSNDVKDYKSNTMNTQGGSCSPLQAPNYNLPMTEENKAEFKKVVDLYTNYENNTVSYNEFNKNKENKDIMPYYDEDMDQYLDINTLNNSKIFTGTSGNEVIPNKSRYMPNYNEKSYTDDNTDKYLNINTKTDDILVAPMYNLSEEDKKNSLRSLNILKRFSDDDTSNKIDGTGEKAKSNNDNNNTFFNIALFIFIGILIILLCDQITELAINIGMKRATEILEPYLNKPDVVQTYVEPIIPSVPSVPDALSVTSVPSVPSVVPDISISDIYKNANVK